MMELLEAADLGSGAWWERVREAGTPLRRDLGDGQIALSFLWRDRQDSAAVYLDVYSHTSHPCRELTGMTRIGASDVWAWNTTLPDDWCGSYFLLPAGAAEATPPAMPARRAWWSALVARGAIADPLNRAQPHSTGWGQPLSPIVLPCAEWEPACDGHDPVDGSLRRERWRSALLENERDIWIFRTGSPVHGESDLPLAILLDGQHWALNMPLFGALDTLTSNGELPPAVYLLIDAGDPAMRGREMPCNPMFWRAVQEELLPQVRARQPFSEDPGRTLVAGQSFGGLAALYGALHSPQRFGLALSQSGSFWWPDPDEAGAGGELVLAAARGHGRPARLRTYLEAGCYEGDMAAVSRAMAAALKGAGHAVRYREYRGGHDWICWRNGLLKGLRHLLNPPSPEKPS